MNAIVEEIRQAYAAAGITLDQPATYGTYYRLLCAGCGRMIGNVGDRLLPGMAGELVETQFELYATGLLGCPCGHQRETARRRDPERWRRSQEQYAGIIAAPAPDPGAPRVDREPRS